MRATTLFTVRAGGGAWAIPSDAVASVERLASGEPSDAPDALGLLGMSSSGEDEARRVVVVQAGGEQARVLVRGAIALTDASPEELLTFPRELAAAAPLVTHVAVLTGKPPLFVVSPERLLRTCRETAASTTPDSDAARGTTC